MDWFCIKDKKPDKDITAYVTNIKAGVNCYVALYNKDCDYFILYNPSIYEKPAIEVTHWMELPDLEYSIKDIQRWHE